MIPVKTRTAHCERRSWKRSVAALVLLSAVLGMPGASAAGGWKLVTSEDGIRVSTREVTGRGFPTFRGVGVVWANIYDVLGVLSDVKRFPQWMERCIVSVLLKKISERKRIVYTRTDAPWPVADRDAVFNSDVDINLRQQTVNVRFWAVRSNRRRKVDGVVRMVNLKGHYKLRRLSETSTRVEVQVDADPGGLLPTWIAKIATRRLPLKTVRNLRRQAKKTKGWYKTRIARWKAGKY